MAKNNVLKRWLFTQVRSRRYERKTGNLMIIAALLLGAWAIYLGSSLPPDPLAQQWSTSYIGLDNYSLTWVGLDCLEVFGLALCGLLFRFGKRSAHVVALLTVPVSSLMLGLMS